MKKLAILGGALALAACANLDGYLSPEQQACIVQTGIAIQSDPAAADLRPQQKAALIAAACEISIDAVLMKAAE